MFVGFATVPGFVSFTSTDGSPYLQALASQPCSDHHLCEDLLLGTDCCFDIAGGVEKISRGDLRTVWGKKCCENLRSPITQPPDNLTAEVIKKVSEDSLFSSNISCLLAGPENPGAVQSLGAGGCGL